MEDANTIMPLIEPSVADALVAIERVEDLPEDKRRHWACSLRVMAKALGKLRRSIGEITTKPDELFDS